MNLISSERRLRPENADGADWSAARLDDHSLLSEVPDEAVNPLDIGHKMAKVCEEHPAIQIGNDLRMTHIVPRDAAKMEHAADYRLKVVGQHTVRGF